MTEAENPRIFDRIISLGGSCAPTYQIRRHYSEDLTFPFDWLTFPLPGVAPALETEMRDDLDYEGIRKGLYINRPVIFGKYAIHIHDLPEEIMGAQDERWRDHIPELQERFQFMWRCLDECVSSADDILFVRSYMHEDEYLRPNFYQLFLDIMSVLKQKYPRPTINLLLVDHKLENPIDIPGVFSFDTTQYAPHDMGCDKGWSEMFETLAIRRRDRGQA